MLPPSTLLLFRAGISVCFSKRGSCRRPSAGGDALTVDTQLMTSIHPIYPLNTSECCGMSSLRAVWPLLGCWIWREVLLRSRGGERRGLSNEDWRWGMRPLNMSVYEFRKQKTLLHLHHARPVWHSLGADSSLEHNESLHFCHEGEMPVGGYRRGGSDRLRRGFLLRQSAQQAHSAEGLTF